MGNNHEKAWQYTHSPFKITSKAGGICYPRLLSPLPSVVLDTRAQAGTSGPVVLDTAGPDTPTPSDSLVNTQLPAFATRHLLENFVFR